jgi:hypothetical protein
MQSTTRHPRKAARVPNTANTPVVRPAVKKAQKGRSYYFAFGANVNKAVLRRRNLQPLQSIPGTVHNYKLLFNHVGGAHPHSCSGADLIISDHSSRATYARRPSWTVPTSVECVVANVRQGCSRGTIYCVKLPHRGVVAQLCLVMRVVEYS